MEVIEKPSFEISRPETMNGFLHIFLRDLEIKFENLPWSKVKELLEIPTTTKEEMETMPVRAGLEPNSYKLEKDVISISVIDCNYQSYEKIMEILKGHTTDKKITK